MKTMYKAYENNPELEVVNVIKDTGKTIHYTIKKFTIGQDLSGYEELGRLPRSERKETDWYKYFNTPKEAQDWLLMKVEARYTEAMEELNITNKVKNSILDMKGVYD